MKVSASLTPLRIRVGPFPELSLKRLSCHGELQPCCRNACFRSWYGNCKPQNEMQAVCGPQTSVLVSSSADVAGTLQFEDVQLNDGACYLPGHKERPGCEVLWARLSFVSTTDLPKA